MFERDEDMKILFYVMCTLVFVFYQYLLENEWHHI